MILIIGAEASGKREFAKGLGYAEKDFADAALDEKRVVSRRSPQKEIYR